MAIGLALLGCQSISESEPVVDATTTVDFRVRGDDLGVDAGAALDAAPDAAIARDGRVHDSAPDAGPDTLTPTDGAPPDARPDGPPPALPCLTPWTQLVDPQDACAGRRVITVTPPVITSGLAIAVADSGRVAIGYSDNVLFDSGNFELRVLDGDSLEVVGQDTVFGVELEGEQYGAEVALAALRETFHVALWVRSDLGGRVEYRQVSPDDVLSEAELVTGVVGRFGALDVAVEPDGVVHTVWNDKLSGALAHRSRDQGGVWGPLGDVDTQLSDEVPGRGAVALALGAGRVTHVGYQLSQSRFGAVPRLRSLLGAEWANARTLDNFENQRVSGVGLDLALVGETRVAAYLDWVGGTGQLRLASLPAGAGEIEYDVRNGAIALAEAPADFALALGSDADGRLHLVAHRPGLDAALEYHRQAPGPEGLRWLVEVIDDEVPSEVGRDALQVDLHVAPDGSVHVVWFDASDGMIHYATRRR